MNSSITIISILFWCTLVSQPNTEVYLLEIEGVDQAIALKNPKNISNNLGYDNQPSFYDDQSILFSANRDGQTDIAKYDNSTGIISWITNTQEGSEYSPFKIPGKESISSVRLDTNGLQRLYQYNTDNGEVTELLKGLKVGYHAWYSEDIIVATILVENRMDLAVCNLKSGINSFVSKNVGRSLHKIPNSGLISYISKEGEEWFINSLDPISMTTNKIASMLPSTEDICWLSDGTILAATDNLIVMKKQPLDKVWKPFWRFKDVEIGNISRMAISPNGRHLAIVSEAPSSNVVQKQVASFNIRDLDTFASCYSENVLVKNFPMDTLYIGNQKLKENYQRFFDKTPKVNVTVLDRITIGNMVIDEESVMIGDKTHRQVAIYEVEYGLISSMTFIHNRDSPSHAENVVQTQLDAYNMRDIDAFVDTFAEDVVAYNFPGEIILKGKEQLRRGYKDFFLQTPDLHCEIEKRIVLGNKVIDAEYITMNGNHFEAVAIYEVGKDKIVKVTFLR